MAKREKTLIQKVFQALFIERRVPDRAKMFFQDLLYKRGTEKAISQVLATPPIELNKDSFAEIRILTNDANVNMTILALKSFLRFCNRVKVVVHDDGSVSAKSRENIMRQIVGAKVVSLEQVDEEIQKDATLWQQRKEAFSYFRFMPITVHKLFDLYMLSNEPKMLIMDSDILFLRKPTMVIDWIYKDIPCNLHAQPRFRNLVIDDSVVDEKFPGLNVIKKFNSGLLCIRKDLLSFDMVLSCLNKLKNDDRSPILGDECVWRFVFSMTASKALPFEQYPLFSDIGRFDDFIKTHEDIGYVHFLLKHKGGFYKKLSRKVLRELS